MNRKVGEEEGGVDLSGRTMHRRMAKGTKGRPSSALGMYAPFSTFSSCKR